MRPNKRPVNVVLDTHMDRFLHRWMMCNKQLLLPSCAKFLSSFSKDRPVGAYQCASEACLSKFSPLKRLPDCPTAPVPPFAIGFFRHLRNPRRRSGEHDHLHVALGKIIEDGAECAECGIYFNGYYILYVISYRCPLAPSKSFKTRMARRKFTGSHKSAYTA